jgi:hypothetical protein
MANDKDIKIGIATQGDTSGAEDVTAALKKLGEAGKEASTQSGFGDNGRAASAARAQRAEEEKAAQRGIRLKEEETEATRKQAEAERELEEAQRQRIDQGHRDVDAAKEKKAAREEQAAGLSRADNATLARGSAYFTAIYASIKGADAMMVKFQDDLWKTGIDLDKLRETNPEDFLWIDAIHSLSNPLQALKDFAQKGLDKFTGLDDLRKSAEQAKDMAEALEKGTEAAERFAEVDNLIRIANLNAELSAVNAITAAMERKIRVERSARDLEETQAGAADNRATQAGADPNVIKAQAQARRAAAEITTLNEDLALANRGIQAAGAEQSKANSELFRIMKEFGADSPEAMEAHGALISARDALENIKDDAAALQQITENKTAEIMVGVEEAFTAAGVDIQTQAGDKGRALVDSITGTGSALTALQQDAQAKAEAILKDGKIAAGEQAGFQQAISQLISGWQGDTQTFLQLVAKGNAISTGLASGLAAVKQEQTRLQARVNQLSGR